MDINKLTLEAYKREIEKLRKDFDNFKSEINRLKETCDELRKQNAILMVNPTTSYSITRDVDFSEKIESLSKRRNNITKLKSVKIEEINQSIYYFIEVCKTILLDNPEMIKPEEIVNEIWNYNNFIKNTLSRDELLGYHRFNWVITKFLREYWRLTMDTIGILMCKDHSSIVYRLQNFHRFKEHVELYEKAFNLFLNNDKNN